MKNYSNYYHDKSIPPEEDIAITPYRDEVRGPLGKPLAITFNSVSEAVRDKLFQNHQDNIVAFTGWGEFSRVVHYDGRFFDYDHGNQLHPIVVGAMPIPKFSKE